MEDYGGRVVVGVSGGVDSSVALMLLKERGLDVVGVFMKNWEETDEDGVCCSAADYDDVRAVCDKLGVPYYSVNFAKEYKERVFSYFLDEYAAGRTPNPDILCNQEIKFRAFLDFAMSLGGSSIATGHYARLDDTQGWTRLLRAADASKDQTYFLAGLTQAQLEKAMFPIGDMQKGMVRELAQKAGLATAAKKDSTGICFIGERSFKPFLMKFLPAQPGEMRTLSGEVKGTHDGLMYYTLGQRRGLGIGGNGQKGRWFVVEKDLQSNVLYVEQGEDSPALYSSALTAGPMNWISGIPPQGEFSCTAKFRYRQSDQEVGVIPLEGESGGFVRIEFRQKQRAVTPGQWAVLYAGEECLGGGPINSTQRQPR